MPRRIARSDLAERLQVLELRVLHGDELVESRLSRVGEAPLLLIADQVKANLIEKGWRQTPNAT
jgi:hypothetical protein